jgi:hypothetical protein
MNPGAESFLLMEANMRIMNSRYWILDRGSRHPDLMERMMQRMSVSLIAAARIDGGMAWSEARTKCIFCRCENECTHWLEEPEVTGNPCRFCPNVEFFEQCAAASKAGQLAESRA